MLTKIILFSLLWFTAESYTRVRVNNYCKDALTIIEGSADGSKIQLCKLTSGASCYKDYSLVDGIKFYQAGWNDAATAAVINFNHLGIDYFDIDLQKGFNLPLNISSNKGASLTCMDKDCPDDINKPPHHLGSVPVNGIFDINFCPTNGLKFGNNGLKLVETSHNPKIMKSKTLLGRKGNSLIGNLKKLVLKKKLSALGLKGQ